MTHYLVRGVYVVVVVLVCPLLAWNLAVAAGTHGYGWPGFLVLLFGVPVAGGLVAAAALRRKRGEAALGAAGAVTATVLLVVVLFFVTFRLVTP